MRLITTEENPSQVLPEDVLTPVRVQVSIQTLRQRPFPMRPHANNPRCLVANFAVFEKEVNTSGGHIPKVFVLQVCKSSSRKRVRNQSVKLRTKDFRNRTANDWHSVLSAKILPNRKCRMFRQSLRGFLVVVVVLLASWRLGGSDLFRSYSDSLRVLGVLCGERFRFFWAPPVASECAVRAAGARPPCSARS